MNQTTIRLEPNLKKDFMNVCDDMGLSISSAITIFAKTVVRERRIPFEIATSKKFNAITEATVAEIEADNGLRRENDLEAFLAELKED